MLHDVLLMSTMAIQIHHVAIIALCLTLLCCACVPVDSDNKVGITYSVERKPNETTTELFIGSTVNLTFEVSVFGKHEGINVILVPKDLNHFDVGFNELHFEGQATDEFQVQVMEVNITGTTLIISEVSLVAVYENQDRNHILTHFLKVKRVPNKVALIVRYSVTAMVVVTVWLMGITTDYKIIVSILKRPYPLIIGMLCQFIIMPFSAWLLAKIFKIEGAAGLGLVLDGSCPGGTNSNLFSVVLDVDYVLSITMTCSSIVIALGMMPLNLFIYGSAFVEAGRTIRTPYLDISIQMLFLVTPLCAGIFFGWCMPKLKEFTEKYLKPVSAFSLVVLLLIDLPFNLFIFESPWNYYIVSVIFPFIGGIAGFSISKLTKLTNRRSITVALETGIQNAVLAAAVLLFSFPQPESDLATRVPYLILIFTTVEGLLLSLLYTILKKYYWHGVPYDDDNTVDITNKENDIKAQDPISIIYSKNICNDGGKYPVTTGQVNNVFQQDQIKHPY